MIDRVPRNQFGVVDFGAVVLDLGTVVVLLGAVVVAFGKVVVGLGAVVVGLGAVVVGTTVGVDFFPPPHAAPRSMSAPIAAMAIARVGVVI